MGAIKVMDASLLYMLLLPLLLSTLQDLLQAGDMSFYFLLPKPVRKPKAKPAATPAPAAETPASAAAAAGASGGGAAAAQQQQQQGQSVPGTPVVGAGTSAAAGASPRLPGFSPGLPQAGAVLPGLLPAAPAGSGGLQHYSSGPILGGLGVAGGGAYPGFPVAGLSGVQGYPGEATLAGSQDLLQQGLGDSLDEGMMDV
jgi:hypothetical protein